MRFPLAASLLLVLAAQTFAADSCLPVPADIVSWWKAEGNTLDSAGGNDATPSPTVAYGAGKIGSGFVFDGTKPGNVSFSPKGFNVGVNDFTLEGWAKTTDTRTYNAIVSFDRYNPGFYIRGDGGLQVYPAGQSPAAGMNDGAFHHFAFVRANGTIIYYKDGAPIGTTVYTAALNPQTVYLGDDLYGGEHFNGTLDEISFYARALTENEIKSIASAAAGKCPILPGLSIAASYSFGTTPVNTSRDATLLLRNTSSNAYSITSSSLDNAGFKLLSPTPPFQVSGNSTQALNVRFSPETATDATSALILNSTDPSHPTLSVQLSGAGVNTTGPGLLGEFFQFVSDINPMPNMNGRTPDFISIFPVVSFPNTDAAFKSVDGITPTNALGSVFLDRFAARFTGSMTIPQEGEYQFDVSSDDGTILKLNGVSVLDRNYLTGCGVTSAKLRLAPGVYPIELDYFENGGSACLDFKVTGPGSVTFSTSRAASPIEIALPAGYVADVFADRIGLPFSLSYTAGGAFGEALLAGDARSSGGFGDIIAYDGAGAGKLVAENITGPIGLACDASGLFGNNLYVADDLIFSGDLPPPGNLQVGTDRLRRVTPTGAIFDFANFSGANRIAFGSAAFGSDLYVVDGYVQRVYRVKPNGAVSEFAAGKQLYGLAFSRGGPFGESLYVGELDTGAILKIAPDGTKTLFATNLVHPSALALDPLGKFGGDLFVTSFSGTTASTNAEGKIYRINSSGTVTTFATGLRSRTYPGADLAFGFADDLFVLEDGRGRILRIKPSSAQGPILSLPNTDVNAGRIEIGQSAEVAIPVRNVGSATLNVSEIVFDSAQVALVSPAPPFSISAGGEQLVRVRFSPQLIGPQSIVATFRSNDSFQNSRTIRIAGIGALSSPFFIEVEDFDYSGGQHRPEADQMPYLGGAYAGLSASAEVDYHDPGANESAYYRAADQGAGMTSVGDTRRGDYDVSVDYKIGWNDPGDWYNYTRVLPSTPREYNIFIRLSSGSASNAVQVDLVTAGLGTTNQTLTKVGEARYPATGDWNYFLSVPVLDANGIPAKVQLSGQKTLRLTMLQGGNEDMNYIELAPVRPSGAGTCIPAAAGLSAWWSGEGNGRDRLGTNAALPATALSFAPGIVGQAFKLSGSEYIHVPASAAINVGTNSGLTLEAWINPDDVNAGPLFEWNTGGYRAHLWIYPSSGTLFANVVDSQGGTHTFNSANGLVKPRAWQHVALTYDRATGDARIYLNGAAVASQNLGKYIPSTIGDLYFGYRPGYRPFQGLIDEPAIYGRALSQPEIAAIVMAGSAGKCPPNIAPAPLISLSATNLNFGTVTNGQTKTLTFSIANNGDAALTVSNITSDNALFKLAAAMPIFVPAGASTNIAVSFSPVSAGAQSGLLTILSDDSRNGRIALSLSGTGAAPPSPVLVAGTNRLDFGSVTLGQSKNLTLSVRNAGDLPLIITNISADASVFTVVSPVTSFTIAAGNSTNVVVRFAPSAAGATNAALTLRGNDPKTPSATIALTGTGTAAPAPVITLLATNLDFGSVQIGQTKTLSAGVKNTGDASLFITSIASDNPIFAVSPPLSNFIIAAGATSNLVVQFSATSTNIQTGAVEIKSSDPKRPSIFLSLTGRGEASATNNCVSPPAGILAWWPGEGNARDIAGGNDGLETNLTYASAIVRQGFSFNGASSLVTIPDTLGLRPAALSLEAWVRFESVEPSSVAAGSVYLISKDHITGGRFFASYALLKNRSAGADHFAFHFASASSELGLDSKLAIVPKTNYHVVATFGGGVASLYINGALDSSLALPAGFSLAYDEGALLFGGSANPVAAAKFQGVLDEITLYHHPLSGDEIKGLCAAGSSGKCNSTQGEFPVIGISPTSLHFDTLKLGEKQDLGYTITNKGIATLVVTGLDIQNPSYSVVAPAFPITIPPAGSEPVTIRFAPKAPGPSTELVRIASNDPKTPSALGIVTGTGVLPPGAPLLLISTNYLDFSSVAAGKSTPLALTLTNGGLGPLTIQGFNLNTNAFQIAPLPTPLILATGATYTVTLQFAPAAAGEFNGILGIRSDDPGSPTTEVRLAGSALIAFDCAPPGSGLVAWWQGESSTNDFLSRHPLQWRNSAFYEDAAVGKGFSLQNGQFLEAAPSADWNFGQANFTIELWARFANAGGTQALLAHDQGPGGVNKWIFWLRNGVLSLHLNGSVGAHDLGTVPFVPNPNEWRHLALVRSASKFQIYIDGRLAGEADYAGEIPPCTAPLTLGQAEGAFSLTGGLDEVTIFSRALSANEILSIASAGTSGKCQIPPDSTPAPFSLRIQKLSDSLGLFWNDPSAHLEAADNVTPPLRWTSVPDAPSLNGAELLVKQNGAGAKRFYRLSGPAGATSAASPYPNLPEISAGGGPVSASQGGTVTTTDGRVSLQVPPGALSADAFISLTNYFYDMTAGAQLLYETAFAPTGLRFSKPVVVSIKFPAGAPVTNIIARTISGENPTVRAGAELSQWQVLPNATLDTASGIARIPMDHFSLLGTIGAMLPERPISLLNRTWEEPVYLVYDLDGQNLKKGDLIYVLSKEPTDDGKSWFPGHAGIYLGSTGAGSRANDGDTIVESTPEDPLVGYRDGVQVSSFRKFKVLGGDHIFMGARRPWAPMDDKIRSRIAGWALDKAALKVPYEKLGGPFIANGGILGGLSCVGLTEGAYESAGISIVPGALEIALWPVRQFYYTKPVEDVTINVGEYFKVFVNGVVRFSILHYTDSSSYYSRSISVEPGSQAENALNAQRAKFEPSLGLFSITPTNDDSDLTLIYKFTVTPNNGYSPVTRRFFVHVRPLVETLTTQDPVFSGDIGEFSGVTETSAMVLDDGATVSVRWPAIPTELLSTNSLDFPITASISGSPASGSSYTVSAYLRWGYTDGSTSSGNGGYALVNDGKRTIVSATNKIPLSKRNPYAVLDFIEIDLSKDKFFNYGEATIRWEFKREGEE